MAAARELAGHKESIITLSNSASRKRYLYLILVVAPLLVLALGIRPDPASGQSDETFIVGKLIDSQGNPVVEAEIELIQESEIIANASSQEDGSFRLSREQGSNGRPMRISIERPHFRATQIDLDAMRIESVESGEALEIGNIELERRLTPGFYAAAVIFALVLALIAFEVLHSTTAALAGLSALFLVHYLGGQFDEGFRIFGFDRGLGYINWEVIFLVLGMMIVIAIIEGTGIFQWTAYQAYRLSRGRAWLLVLILMLVTAVASALLDNFTTMLLMTPISLQIALAIGINPLALIIPEVLASNVGGISTLIGTPTNILIGAHADIGFSDFLINQTVGVVVALIVMAAFVLYHYRSEWAKAPRGVSDRLMERLEASAEIREKDALVKSGVVFVLILAGFVLGERIHLVPAVPALVGATALLIWLNPDVQELIKAVDWTTLVFFFAIFVVIGGIQEVGLISILAGAMSRLIGDSIVLAIFAVVFGAGTLSIAIANIPLAASMLPIVDFLSGSVPGASGKVLYYALSMGAAMGGNGFLIGGEANLVTAGISRQAGSPVSFGSFLRVGLPVTYLTLIVGFAWLVLHFVILGN